MNRVFSGYYPHDVCGVVYQNADRHLACQFTFACEGKDLNQIDEPDMWEQAKRIAKDTLDGKIWLADIGHATHYHAYWVHPSWVHEMVRLYKLGVHTFYRPRNWGDGDDDWGPTEIKAETMRPDPEVMSANPEPAPQDRDSGGQGSASRGIAGLGGRQQRTDGETVIFFATLTVIARSAATKQSSPALSPGLLRFARNDGSHISISSPTSRLCTEWVSAPDDR